MGIRERDNEIFMVRDGILYKYAGKCDAIVSIPDGIIEIDGSAFLGHCEIERIIIPNSVIQIGQYAFVSCTALKNVNIGSGIKTIPVGCFMGLRELESVSLFDTIESIDDFAFRGCKSFRCFHFLTMQQRSPVTAEEKGEAFEAMMLGKPSTISYVAKAEYIPSIKRIGNYAFAECPEFDCITLQEKAIQLGMNAFDVAYKFHSPPEQESSVYEAEEDIFIEKAEEEIDELASEEFATICNSQNDDSEATKKDTPVSIPGEHTFESEHDICNPNQPMSIRDGAGGIHDTEYLIEGFVVDGDLIVYEASGKSIVDASVGALGLSNRAYNCLNREKASVAKSKHKEVMISDVLQLSMEQLISIRKMGRKTAEEVFGKVRTYLWNMLGIEEGISSEEAVIAPGYEVKNGVITESKTGMLIEDVDLEFLGLGVRAINSLRGGGIHYLSGLIKTTSQQLMHFPNMGEKTVSEIKEIIPAYLELHKVESLDTGRDDNLTPSKVPVSAFSILDPDTPVLAPEYIVVDGVIYSRKTYKIIRDAKIETLGLSVRSLNCLVRSDKLTISSLVGMPFTEFRQIRNLGILSANEIQEKLEQYLEREQATSVLQAIPDTTVSRQEVLSCFKENEFEAKSFDGLLEMLPNAEENDLRGILDELIQSRKITSDNNLYTIYHPSFYEFIKSLNANSGLDERAIRILKMRASGSTLEEVGQIEGTTRERIRQIERKALDRITRRGSILFEEDRYAHVFTTYSFEREFYLDYLDESKDIWYYLNFRYARGKCDPFTAIEDKSVTTSIRRSIDKYIHRGYAQIDGEYILLQRSDIEDYIVEKFCKNEVTLDEFFEIYNQFLTENGLMSEKLVATDTVKATRGNRLSESLKLLWKQNQRLRYYDIEGTDYTELFETLNLGQYHNVELSSRKFLIDYPELMERYDLRDEYEVHNLLKKIHAERENPELIFGRMPNLQFGVFDRDTAVKEMLFALAPISQDDLAMSVSLEYGVRPETVKANWLSCIFEYYHQGMYFIDYEDMPEEHMILLKESLTEDFYFLSELRRIYSTVVPNADLSLLSTYNLKKMGFLVGASYVIQHYSTAEAYFAHLLTEKDVVDIVQISKRYTGLSTYSSYLAKLKHDMEIIEFEPFQYINIRRLEKLGFSKEKLREYSDRVWSYLIDDDYFTIQSLKRSGFKDELDVLGFGDMFYSSILKEDERFSWQRVGNNVVLCPKGQQFTVHDFLVDRVSRERAVDVDDFVSDLANTFGIFFSRSEIIEKVKGSDVYYDSIMEKLYADYATYFEEI